MLGGGTLGDPPIGNKSFHDLVNWNPWKRDIAAAVLTILLIGLFLGVWHKPSKCCADSSALGKACPKGQVCGGPIEPCKSTVMRVLTIGEASFFDFNKPTVRPEAARVLDRFIVASKKSSLLGTPIP